MATHEQAAPPMETAPSTEPHARGRQKEAPEEQPTPAAETLPTATSDQPPLAPATEPRPAASPAPSEPPAPPSAATPAADGDLGLLLTRWKEIVESVRPATRAVITECRPMAVEGNIVTLGFPEAKAFLKDVAERKRPDLEAAVGGFLGRAVTVRCVATNVDIVPPASDGDADPDFVLSEARRIFADDLVDVGEVS
jgi:hypothetical protein